MGGKNLVALTENHEEPTAEDSEAIAAGSGADRDGQGMSSNDGDEDPALVEPAPEASIEERLAAATQEAEEY